MGLAREAHRQAGLTDSAAGCTSRATPWRTPARRSRRISAAIGTVFVQDSADAARAQWRSVADQLRDKFPKLGAPMDDAENDVLAFMTFPRAHWTQIYSTNPLERLNAEIKRRTNVVGIFPNDASITRLVGAMMHEQNDECSLIRRYMQLEGLQTLGDTAPTRLSAVAR